jgi:hypothetical protein
MTSSWGDVEVRLKSWNISSTKWNGSNLESRLAPARAMHGSVINSDWRATVTEQKGPLIKAKDEWHWVWKGTAGHLYTQTYTRVDLRLFRNVREGWLSNVVNFLKLSLSPPQHVYNMEDSGKQSKIHEEKRKCISHTPASSHTHLDQPIKMLLCLKSSTNHSASLSRLRRL